MGGPKNFYGDSGISSGHSSCAKNSPRGFSCDNKDLTTKTKPKVQYSEEHKTYILVSLSSDSDTSSDECPLNKRKFHSSSGDEDSRQNKRRKTEHVVSEAQVLEYKVEKAPDENKARALKMIFARQFRRK